MADENISADDLLLKPVFNLEETITESPEVKEPSGPDSVSEFDQRWRDSFTGLIYIGHLSDEVTIFGHRFLLETPTQTQRLKAGVIHKPYLNTISGEIAWAAITVALYLKMVDGEELPQSIGPADTDLEDRFKWVSENLRAPVMSALYEQALLLDNRVGKSIEELERLGKF